MFWPSTQSSRAWVACVLLAGTIACGPKYIDRRIPVGWTDPIPDCDTPAKYEGGKTLVEGPGSSVRALQSGDVKVRYADNKPLMVRVRELQRLTIEGPARLVGATPSGGAGPFSVVPSGPTGVGGRQTQGCATNAIAFGLSLGSFPWSLQDQRCRRRRREAKAGGGPVAVATAPELSAAA